MTSSNRPAGIAMIATAISSPANPVVNPPQRIYYRENFGKAQSHSQHEAIRLPEPVLVNRPVRYCISRTVFEPRARKNCGCAASVSITRATSHIRIRPNGGKRTWRAARSRERRKKGIIMIENNSSNALFSPNLARRFCEKKAQP